MQNVKKLNRLQRTRSKKMQAFAKIA